MKEKISIKEKGTSVSANSLIWFGAGVSIAEILTGTYLAPLGFGKGLAAIVLISGFLFVLAGIVSSALEIFFTFSTVFLSRYFYGRTKRLISQSP